MSDWLTKWNKYAAERTKYFESAGCTWPGVPLVNGELNEHVCSAIMEQSKGKK